MVCVNLYPFRQTIAKEGVEMAEAIENIDIGGPSMLRSAAKNYKDVTVVCDPADYAQILDEIKAEGNTKVETRLQLSAKAYTHTAEYDMCIATYMRKQAGLSEKLFLEFDEQQSLRYGENPHQSAKFYRDNSTTHFSLAYAEQLNGKELSYNNIQDANAALNIVREFEEPFCVALKHMNPCGAAIGADAMEAWTRAYEADTKSIFGGIVALNREVTAEVALGMKPIFLEIVMAPSFTPEALEILCAKKNLRVLKVDMTRTNDVQNQYISVNGGLLKRYCGVSNEKIKKNYQTLTKSGKAFITRVPLIPGVTDTEENLTAIALFMKESGANNVEVLPYNKLAGSKYASVLREYQPDFDPEQALCLGKEIFESHSIEYKKM